jgi:hypothetical protein
MTGIVNDITVENLLTPNTIRCTPTSTATVLNGTLSLSVASGMLQILTGTATGFAVSLPDATTLQNGWVYEIWNASSQTVTVNAVSALFTLTAGQTGRLTLQSNATQAGTWLFTILSTGTGGQGGGGSDGDAVLMAFGFDGSASTGRWLESLTNVGSDSTQPVIAGAKTIRAMSFGAASSATCTATILKNGVALNTITLTSQIRNTKLSLSHALVNLDYISCQITSGSATRPIVILWG